MYWPEKLEVANDGSILRVIEALAVEWFVTAAVDDLVGLVKSVC